MKDLKSSHDAAEALGLTDREWAAQPMPGTRILTLHADGRTTTRVASANESVRGPSKTPLINREHVRAFILDLAKSRRAHKWDRVSEQTLLTVNEVVRAWCVRHVAGFPSKGKTL